MLSSYLKRPECKRYVKSVLKDPLLVCVKETTKIRLDPDELERLLEKRKLHKSNVASSMLKSDGKTKQRTETIAFQPQSAVEDQSEKPNRPASKTLIMSSEEFHKIRNFFHIFKELIHIAVPKFKAKKINIENQKDRMSRIPEELKVEPKTLLQQVEADSQK